MVQCRASACVNGLWLVMLMVCHCGCRPPDGSSVSTYKINGLTYEVGVSRDSREQICGVYIFCVDAPQETKEIVKWRGGRFYLYGKLEGDSAATSSPITVFATSEGVVSRKRIDAIELASICPDEITPTIVVDIPAFWLRHTNMIRPTPNP